MKNKARTHASVIASAAIIVIAVVVGIALGIGNHAPELKTGTYTLENSTVDGRFEYDSSVIPAAVPTPVPAAAATDQYTILTMPDKYYLPQTAANTGFFLSFGVPSSFLSGDADGRVSAMFGCVSGSFCDISDDGSLISYGYSKWRRLDPPSLPIQGLYWAPDTKTKDGDTVIVTFYDAVGNSYSYVFTAQINDDGSYSLVPPSPAAAFYETAGISSLGNASAVGKIINALPPLIDNYTQQYFSIGNDYGTGFAPFTLTLYYERDGSKNGEPLDPAAAKSVAIMLFTKIVNLKEVSFATRETLSGGELDETAYTERLTYNYQNFGRYTDLDNAVSASIYIVNSPYNHQPGSGFISYQYEREAHVTLKTDVSGNQTTVYAVALYKSYAWNGFMITNEYENLAPVALTFVKDADGYYNLTKYLTLTDGGEYSTQPYAADLEAQVDQQSL